MRALEGVIHKRRLLETDELKKYLLLFDRLHLTGVWGMSKLDASVDADIDYLNQKGVVADMGGTVDCNAIENKRRLLALHAFARAHPEIKWEDPRFISADVEVRIGATLISKDRTDVDIVPIYRNSIWSQNIMDENQTQTVLDVALEQFPVCSASCPLDNILDFKQEMQDKKWDFRRFLHSLATKKQTEAEIRDDIEWTLNEYRKAMELHHINASQSFIDVFLISPLEILEDLVKFRWSKLAKGVFSVGKRNVELTEAEMNAHGKECAYLFDARKRFGSESR
jgi:hypothetical protein